MVVKNIIIIVGLVITVLMAWWIVGNRVVPNEQQDSLVVGIASGYAPFVSLNAQGEYEGFDIDCALALAKQMNKSVEFKDLGSMTSLFTGLEQGVIDVVMWGISITQQRLKKVAMVHYQGTMVDKRALLFWQNIPDNISCIADMKGMMVAVEPASSEDEILRKYTYLTPLFVDKIDDALLSIQYGKAAAAFVEPTIAKKFMKKYPQIKQLIVPLDEQDIVQGCGIVIKKDSKSSIAAVQKAVDELKQAGIIGRLEAKWGLES